MAPSLMGDLKDFSVLHTVQTPSGAHRGSYTKDTNFVSLEVMRPGQLGVTLRLCDEVKEACNCTSTPQYSLLACESHYFTFGAWGGVVVKALRY